MVPQLPGHGADQRPEVPAAGPAAAAPAGQVPAKRWSFGKSSRDSAEATVAAQAPVSAGNAVVAWLRSAVEAPLPSPSVKADTVDPQLAVAAAGPPPAMAAAVLDLAPVVNREGEVSGE